MAKVSFLLLLVVIAILGLLAIVPLADIGGKQIASGIEMIVEAPVKAPPTTGGYSSIPMTEHALEAHQFETWNPVSIAAYYDAGKCKPKMYACDDFTVHWCDMGNNKAIALVIGKYVKQIITGYMGNVDYWRNRCGS